MTARSLAWMLACLAAGDWTGDWVTDMGLLELRQRKDSIEGEYGQGGSLRGQVVGDGLEFEWSQGREAGRGRFEVVEREAGEPIAFRGQVLDASGSPAAGRIWRGWRKDPDAEKGKAADFSGHWLSSFGTMRLEQRGTKLKGTYGAEGLATVEGVVKGRRAQLRWKRIDFPGKAWIEQTPTGERFFGISEGSPPEKWLGLRVGDFEHGVAPEPGEVVQGITDAGLLYFLRVPPSWRRGRAVDAIVLLHGSNWTTRGMVAVTDRNWPELGERFAILGIQGQSWVDTSEADDLRFNYTYVNWMGRSTYQGYPYTDRESPSLVAEALVELRERHDLARVLLGGHSQGAFLATILAMHHPELLDGVFSMAGGMVIQAEPDVFDDQALRAAQRATPIAIVHGRQDAVVPPSTGDYVHERLLASGFPMLRLFSPEAGHAYDFLPVGDVVAWLDALSTDDVERLAELAQDAAASGAWRDVAAACSRAEHLKAGASLRAAREAYDEAARVEADRWLAAIEANADADWIDPFLAWRDSFEFAPAAAPVMQAFRSLQAEHDEKAEKLLADARAAFQNGRADVGRQKQREVVERWYACKRYRVVKGWLGG